MTNNDEINYLKAENKELRRQFDKLKKMYVEMVEDNYEMASRKGDPYAQTIRYQAYEDAGILDEL
jgi:hypothetical protein